MGVGAGVEQRAGERGSEEREEGERVGGKRKGKKKKKGRGRKRESWGGIHGGDHGVGRARAAVGWYAARRTEWGKKETGR